jgi:hypothetical protein
MEHGISLIGQKDGLISDLILLLDQSFDLVDDQSG